MKEGGRRKAEGGRRKAEGGTQEEKTSFPFFPPTAYRLPPSAFSYFVWATAALFVLGFVSLVLVAPAARAGG